MAASASRPKRATSTEDSAGTDGIPIVWLKKRKDFVRTQHGRSWRTPGYVLTARPRGGGKEAAQIARFGCTVTKKIGNAVRRNRVKRRMREAIRHIGPYHARPGYDYVLIARGSALDQSFADLLEELRTGLQRIHVSPPPRGNHLYRGNP